ncbi:MAG: hypothetical protein JJ992_25875, partial [Planctomycetes bacterium]|nr:hypothetical protein [Planctomycetota bacterium]
MALQNVWVSAPLLGSWRRFRATHNATPIDNGSRLRRDLRAIVGDGAAFSVMVGIGETYVPAFVLALGLGGIAAGMVATVPVLLGAVLQLVSPWAVQRLGSRRQWVVVCARCQAVSLLLLAMLALFQVRWSWPIFLLATFYWAGGLATGPAWNTWVES